MSKIKSKKNNHTRKSRIKHNNNNRKSNRKNNNITYKVCKNNICVDSRTIKSYTNKRRNKIETFVYYFYEISSKKMYELSVASYEKFKTKVGYLLYINYDYFINDYMEDIEHVLTTDPWILNKATPDELKQDAFSDGGVTAEKPYLFIWNNMKVGRDKIPKQKRIKNNSKKMFKDVYSKYMKTDFSKFNKIDYSVLNPYKGTYEELLKIAYTKCNDIDNRIFNF
jgi:hypothetical protein